MARKGTAELTAKALATLRDLGYRRVFKSLDRCQSRSVYCFCKDDLELWYLVQVRHYQEESTRYLVGIMIEALQHVDQVVLYFEGEPKILVFPATFLRDILRERIGAGDAHYSGSDNGQWRVDFHLSEDTLSPVGSDGDRYDVSGFVVNVADATVIDPK